MRARQISCANEHSECDAVKPQLRERAQAKGKKTAYRRSHNKNTKLRALNAVFQETGNLARRNCVQRSQAEERISD